ncbi:H-NS histone family protein [Citrobacter portucalensis]|uniref:H-NS histone family protein n=1 Tax=Citrobacter portucalensis TaxID=1639133 RepID=A0A5B0SVY9_9ENTR|nr:H-NS histone family protein [Citrobacter portucalensis]KAA1141987.1 H-NS histone family protein [Citrobacter portucalensis]HCB1716936.1 H-NS histone family protein [Citrobacter freundii]
MTKNLPTVAEVIQFLRSVPRRTSLFKKMELRELSIISADLTTELDKRITQQKQLEQQEKERHNIIQHHLNLLKQDGIAPDELIKAKKRPSIGPVQSYRVNGQLIHYKGVGKYPRALREIIDLEGKEALQKYEVKKD